MKLTILHKLVLALLGLTFVVLAATLGLARWSFERGFLDYVNAIEQVRLQALASDLQQDYANGNNSWSSLTASEFHERMQATTLRAVNEAGGELGGGAFLMRPDRRDLVGQHEQVPRERRSRGDGGGPARRGPPPPDKRVAAAPATSLYTVSGERLFGPALGGGASIMHIPVIVNGETVGELRSAPRRILDSPQATTFSHQQFQTSILIGAAALILAALVSILLARIFLAPLREVISNMNRLSNGDYDVRIHSTRSDELGLLARDFDRLAVTLEKNQSARKRWLADISHELRTPLTILHGELEALKDGVRAFNAEQLESFDQEVQRLHHIVNDLYELSVSDIGGLRYTFGLLDIRDSLDDAVESLHAGAHAAGIQIDVDIGDDPILVLADKNRLEQLFRNLLRNSLAYTDSPGLVSIKIAKGEQVAIITINDTAPGASDAECELLFDPLYRQEQSRNRRSAGAGLGLSICKNIVEAHRGTIKASPSHLGGLTIQIDIPVDNVEH